MDLLGNKNQDMTLEQVLRFVEAKEAGKRSASRLSLPHATDAVAGSSYRCQKITAVKGPPPKDQEVCTYSGSKGYGKIAPTSIRRKDCPAFGTVCGHCSRDHHFRMCRSRNDAKTARNGTEGEQENAISNTLCGVMSETSDKYATLDHQIITNPPANGQKGNPNPNHSLHYPCACEGKTMSVLD